MTDDYISRQAAIDALEKVAELFPWRVPGNRDSYDRYNEAWNDAIGRAEIEIEKLPSAQQERKKGKWIYNSPVTMKCNQCGFVIKDWDWHRFKYCPNCIADMRGEQE